jgi:hypothetical protein
MKIIATRNIEIGEEITVSYNEGVKGVEKYFGKDNCGCLCKTCEDKCRNGWGSTNPIVLNESPKPSPRYSLRHARVESLDDLPATQAVRSGSSTSKDRSGPSTSLGSDATEKSAENDENAQNQCVVPKYEKRTRASTNLGLVDCTRVPGDYLRLGPHVQLVAWTHSDRCVMAALAQAKDVPDSCPVCERHRKLYGYRWPKTKKTGKSDNEESVYSLAS